MMRWSHLADLGNKQSGVYSRFKGPVARCSSVCLKTRRLVRPGPWRAQASLAGGGWEGSTGVRAGRAL